MYQSWMLKYRPHDFSYIVGQAHVTLVLLGMLEKGFIIPSMIIAGPWGVGKTSIARITAKTLLCSTPVQGRPCGQCDSCRNFDAGTNINYLEQDAASSGKVADIRELIKLCAYPPVESSRRVIVLDEAQRITSEGWHALLKTLEDSVEHTVFLFCTTEPDKILDTIKSRSRLFQLKALSAPEISAHLGRILAAEGITQYDATVLESIAVQAKGHLRDAINTLEQLVICGQVSHEMLNLLSAKVDLLAVKEKLSASVADPTALLLALPEWMSYFTPQDIARTLQDVITQHQVGLWKIEMENIIPGLGDTLPLMEWMSSAPLPTTFLQLQNYVLQLMGRMRTEAPPQKVAAPIQQAQGVGAPPEVATSPYKPPPPPKKRAQNDMARPKYNPSIEAAPQAALQPMAPMPVPQPAQMPQQPVFQQPTQIPQQPVAVAVPTTTPAQPVAPPANFLAQFAVTKAIPSVGEASEDPVVTPPSAAPAAAPTAPNSFLAQFAVKKSIPAVGEASEV